MSEEKTDGALGDLTRATRRVNVRGVDLVFSQLTIRDCQEIENHYGVNFVTGLSEEKFTSTVLADMLFRSLKPNYPALERKEVESKFGSLDLDELAPIIGWLARGNIGEKLAEQARKLQGEVLGPSVASGT